MNRATKIAKTTLEASEQAKAVADMSADEQASLAATLLAKPDEDWKPLSATGTALHVAARKRGRPRLPEGEKREKVMVAFDPDVLLAVDSLAASEGASRSAWVEEACITLLMIRATMIAKAEPLIATSLDDLKRLATMRNRRVHQPNMVSIDARDGGATVVAINDLVAAFRAARGGASRIPDSVLQAIKRGEPAGRAR
jgi:hypothetical protein